MLQQSLEVGSTKKIQQSAQESESNCPVMAASEAMAIGGGHEARGAIFTRPEVVDFILDLAGYTEDQPLHKKRLLEPSFGGGDFLLPIIDRLLCTWRAARPNGSAFDELADAIRAVELRRRCSFPWSCT